ncbi:MAG: 8-amino-7-oxononanoate synthase [Pseudomonadota bacterium]
MAGGLPDSWQRRLSERLDQRHRQQRYRQSRTKDAPQAARYRSGGQTRRNFAGNDYLGLANHPALARALAEGARQYGVGAGAAHLLGGHQTPHQQLEEALAEWTGRPAALLFSTGYMANLAVATALVGLGDSLIQDKLNHASMIDGARLSQAELLRYPHGDSEAALRQLQRADGLKLLMTDGVFSMDGDLAPLAELVAHSRREDALLMVDDAHGLGVLGERGGGSLEHLGLNGDDVPLLMGTLGKGLGSFGAFVAGSEPLIDSLRQFGRSYLFTTAAPAALASATLTALQLLREENWRRQALAEHIGHFRHRGGELGLPLLPSDTPIQPLMLGDEATTMTIAAKLDRLGFDVGAIRPPTVPEGQCRLRLTLRADHQNNDIDALLDALAGALDA